MSPTGTDAAAPGCRRSASPSAYFISAMNAVRFGIILAARPLAGMSTLRRFEVDDGRPACAAAAKRDVMRPVLLRRRFDAGALRQRLDRRPLEPGCGRR